jgi:capsular polysaccharide biosynthesis protein
MNITKLWFPKRTKKEKILIFGTGSGGHYLYNSIQNQKEIIGFLDNNLSKHGTKFCGKNIFNPLSIPNLNFDRIIIASDYYKEIFQQLTEELGVTEQKIGLYHSEKRSEKETFAAIKVKFGNLILKTICSNSTLRSKITYKITAFFSSTMRLNQINNLLWLDELEKSKLITFVEKLNGFSYTPKFLGRHQNKQLIIIPNISAYRFENATISPINSAISLDGNLTILTRVPSLADGSADYSGGNIIAHGSKKILLRKSHAENIQRGIAITGSSDTNYYHWILEVLSKLQYIRLLPKNYSDYPILISEKAQQIPSIKKLLDLFTIENEIIWLKSSQQYCIDQLIYITPPNYIAPNLALGEKYDATNCYISTNSIRYLKKIALSHQKQESNTSSGKRIFLARKHFIRSYNQNDVIALLAHYDFDAVYLEDLSFLEQVDLMQQAEHIIGPTGAAWTNLIFANSGIKALTWIPKEAGDFSGYSSLAHHIDIQLDFITYYAGTQDTRGMYVAPYTIDCKKIEEWIVENVMEMQQ